MEVEQRIQKIKKNHSYVALEEILNFVESRGIGSGEELMTV